MTLFVAGSTVLPSSTPIALSSELVTGLGLSLLVLLSVVFGLVMLLHVQTSDLLGNEPTTA